MPTPVKKHAAETHTSPHPDHGSEVARLKRIKGQVEGIERMIADRRYCPDIIMQVRAATSALKALEKAILRTHLGSCVKEAIQSKDRNEAETKIQELLELI